MRSWAWLRLCPAHRHGQLISNLTNEKYPGPKANASIEAKRLQKWLNFELGGIENWISGKDSDDLNHLLWVFFFNILYTFCYNILFIIFL